MRRQGACWRRPSRNPVDQVSKLLGVGAPLCRIERAVLPWRGVNLNQPKQAGNWVSELRVADFCAAPLRQEQ